MTGLGGGEMGKTRKGGVTRKTQEGGVKPPLQEDIWRRGESSSGHAEIEIEDDVDVTAGIVGR